MSMTTTTKKATLNAPDSGKTLHNPAFSSWTDEQQEFQSFYELNMQLAGVVTT